VLGTGEPDANAEAMTALRRKQQPLYLEGFVKPPNFDMRPFMNGEKFILIGQKGTGKTAILRNLQAELSRDGYSTEYIIFRETIQYEENLMNLPFTYAVEKKDLQSTPIYQHALKRIILTALLSCIKRNKASGFDVSGWLRGRSADPESFVTWVQSFVQKALATDIGQSITMVIDSVIEDQSKARELLGLNEAPSPAQVRTLLKRLNERLLSFCVYAAKSSGAKAAIFMDEIHFQYTSDESLRDDAYLVRDAINACHAVNSRFINENLSVGIYIGLRSEYLSHPIVAQAELRKTIASFAFTIDWSTMPFTDRHPIFLIASSRANAALRHFKISGDTEKFAMQIISSIFSNFGKINFLEYTWGKPRDIVWFLKKVVELYPEKRTLSRAEFNAVLRAYSRDSWEEMKAGLSSFLGEDSLAELDNILKMKASISLEQGQICKYDEFLEYLNKHLTSNPFSENKGGGERKLFEVLYQMGIFYTQRAEADGKVIFDRFHRGQDHPNHKGDVVMHRLVAKAFS
jgi:hypothetical protein